MKQQPATSRGKYSRAPAAFFLVFVVALSFIMPQVNSAKDENPGSETNAIAPQATTPQETLNNGKKADKSENESTGETPAHEEIPRGAGFDRAKYCRNWSDIAGSTPDPTSNDEGGADLRELERTFRKLHTLYSDLADVAPADLTGAFGKVLGYLEQTQQTIKSENIDDIRIMISNLGTLNDSMAAIDSKSKQLCQ